MANKDNPNGFQPWGPVLRARLYPVITAPTINICVGDLVCAEVAGVTSAKIGSTIAIYDAAVIPATPGDNFLIIGAVQAVYDENMQPLTNAPSGYIVPARAGDGTVAGYALVADHPYQEYVAQADAAVTAGDLDLNYEVTSVALSAPNSKTGISQQEINVSGANVTVTIPIRIYGQAYPAEDVITNAGSRWICQINPLCHLYGAGVTPT